MRGNGARFILALAVCWLLVAAQGPAEGAVYRVSNKGSLKGDGSSWSKALQNQTFIDTLEKAKPGDEFWIAEGIYIPMILGGGSRRQFSFVVNRGVALYGGFKGTETKRIQRDWKKNKTILSGELQGDNNPGNNSYHVVLIPSTADRTTVVDGFVITGGYAVDKPEFASGGGLQNQGSPVIANCVFENNQAKFGGGLYTWNTPSITNCVFTKNFAVEDGGGMGVNQGSPTVTDCTFSYNRASGFGGGLSYYGSKNILLKSSTFISNQSLSKEGGALYISHSKGAVVNSTFFNNSAKLGGGGIATYKSSPRVVNCTLYQNKSAEEEWGHDMYVGRAPDDGKSLQVQNCILWGDGGVRLGVSEAGAPIASHCVVQGGLKYGTFIIFGDPQLKNPADNGGPTRTCAIGQSSSAIDNGEPHLAPKEDQRGMPRPAGKGVDIGAYEEQKPVYYPVSGSGSSKTPDFTVGPSKGKPVQKQPTIQPQKPPQKPQPGKDKPPASKPSTSVKPVKPGSKPSAPPVKKPPAAKPPAAKPPGIK